MNFKANSMIKRMLTFLLAFAMVATSVYVTPVALAVEEDVVVEEETTVSEEVVLEEQAPAEETGEEVTDTADQADADAAKPRYPFKWDETATWGATYDSAKATLTEDVVTGSIIIGEDADGNVVTLKDDTGYVVDTNGFETDSGVAELSEANIGKYVYEILVNEKSGGSYPSGDGSAIGGGEENAGSYMVTVNYKKIVADDDGGAVIDNGSAKPLVEAKEFVIAKAVPNMTGLVKEDDGSYVLEKSDVASTANKENDQTGATIEDFPEGSKVRKTGQTKDAFFASFVPAMDAETGTTLNLVYKHSAGAEAGGKGVATVVIENDNYVDVTVKLTAYIKKSTGDGDISDYVIDFSTLEKGVEYDAVGIVGTVGEDQNVNDYIGVDLKNWSGVSVASEENTKLKKWGKSSDKTGYDSSKYLSTVEFFSLGEGKSAGSKNLADYNKAVTGAVKDVGTYKATVKIYSWDNTNHWTLAGNGDGDVEESVLFDIKPLDIGKIEGLSIGVTFKEVDGTDTATVEDSQNKTFVYNGNPVVAGNIDGVVITDSLEAGALKTEIEALDDDLGQATATATVSLRGEGAVLTDANQNVSLSKKVPMPEVVLAPKYGENDPVNLIGELVYKVPIAQYDLKDSGLDIKFKSSNTGLGYDEADGLIYNEGNAIDADNVVVAVPTTGGNKTTYDKLSAGIKEAIGTLLKDQANFKKTFTKGKKSSAAVALSLSDVTEGIVDSGADNQPKVTISTIADKNFKWTDENSAEIDIHKASPKGNVTFNRNYSVKDGATTGTFMTDTVSVSVDYAKTSGVSTVFFAENTKKAIEITAIDEIKPTAANKLFSAALSTSGDNSVAVSSGNALLKFKPASTASTAGSDDKAVEFKVSFANYKDVTVKAVVNDDATGRGATTASGEMIKYAGIEWTGNLAESLNTKVAASGSGTSAIPEHYEAKTSGIEVGYLGQPLSNDDIGKIEADKNDKFSVSDISDIVVYEKIGDAFVPTSLENIKDVSSTQYKLVETFKFTNSLPAGTTATYADGTYKIEATFTVVAQTVIGGEGILSGVRLSDVSDTIDPEIFRSYLTYNTFGAGLVKGDVVATSENYIPEKPYQYRNDADRKPYAANENPVKTGYTVVDLTGNGLTEPVQGQPYVVLGGSVSTGSKSVANAAKVVVIFDIERTEPIKTADTGYAYYYVRFGYRVPATEDTEEDWVEIAYNMQAGRKLVDPKIKDVIAWGYYDANDVAKVWDFENDIVSFDVYLTAIYAQANKEVVSTDGKAKRDYKLLAIPEQTYTGKKLTPVVTVIDGVTGKAVPKNKITFTIGADRKKNVTDANETTGYDVTVKVKKDGKFPETEVGTTKFYVEKGYADVDNATLAAPTLLTISGTSWKAKNINPVKNVKVGKITLKAGKDYTVAMTDPDGKAIAAANGKFSVTKPGVYRVSLAAGTNKNWNIDTDSTEYVVADKNSALSKAKVSKINNLKAMPLNWDVTDWQTYTGQEITINVGTQSAVWKNTAAEGAAPSWQWTGDGELKNNLCYPEVRWNGKPGKATVWIGAVPVSNMSTATKPEEYVYGEITKTFNIAADKTQKLNKKGTMVDKLQSVNYTGEGKNLEDTFLLNDTATPAKYSVTTGAANNIDYMIIDSLGFKNTAGEKIAPTAFDMIDDYVNISYAKNIKAGTAKVTIEAKAGSGMTGKITVPFKINKVKLNDAVLGEKKIANTTGKLIPVKGTDGKITGYEINASELTIKGKNYVGVSAGLISNIATDTMLAEKTDYTVKLVGDKTVAGTKDLKIVLTGKGNYSDAASKNTITITVKRAAAATTETKEEAAK